MDKLYNFRHHKLFFIFISIFFIFSSNIYSQAPDTLGSFKKDTLKIPRNKKPPGGFFNKMLFYMSPTKTEMVDSIVYIPTHVSSGSIGRNTVAVSDQVSEDKYNKNRFGVRSERDWDTIYSIKYTPPPPSKGKLNKEVYGYHPYWVGSAYKSYDFSLLTRLAYFSYVINPKTGKPSTVHNWKKTDIVTLAHNEGCKVDLCVTNFGKRNNAVFLSNKKAQAVMIENVIQLIIDKGADGINIDFEEIRQKQRKNFTDFIINLKTAMLKANSRFKLTVAVPAVDWRNVYDLKALKEPVDLFFIMAYDYHANNSPIAGPNSQLFSGSDWGEHNINTTVNYYIANEVPPSKILLGLPYYGRVWETEDGKVPSKNKGFIQSRSYSFIRSNYADKYMNYYDPISHSTYYIFRDGEKWIQCWTDDEKSLAKKYDYILAKKIAGAGIWALGYDNGYTALWNLIEDKFAKPIEIVQDSLYERLGSLMDNSMANKAIVNVNKTDPAMVFSFASSMENSLRVFTLSFIILMSFVIIGFLIAISDYDVRFVLFNTEVRVYMFIMLVLLLLLILLRIWGALDNLVIILISAVVLGIFTSLIILNVGKMKKSKRLERKP